MTKTNDPKLTTLEEILKELNELYNRTVEIENKEIKLNAIEILDTTRTIITDLMEQAECRFIKFNTKGKEKGVLNYLPATFMEGVLTSEFIEQIIKEVIKNMKEYSSNFKELPIGNKIELDSEVISKAGNSEVSTIKDTLIEAVENNEKAMEKIKEAMNLIRENINMIMNQGSMNRFATAALEDLMSSERQLLDRLVYLRIANDKLTR